MPGMNSKPLSAIPDKDISVFRMPEEWQTPYMYRKRIEGECELFDSTNGVYPNEDRWNTDIILKIKAWTDENGRIIGIDYYKVRDLGGGCGRPQTRSAELNAAEKNVFCSILDKCTISRAGAVLPYLIEKARTSRLPNGWTVIKSNASSVEFRDKTGNTTVIPKSRIQKYLEVSYCYIDILANGNLWDANPKFLKEEDKEPMLALFSLVDANDYYKLDELKSAAERRMFEAEKAGGYIRLCDACERDDAKEVKKYCVYLQGSPNAASETTPPLHTAIFHNNMQIAKLLLKNGAYVNQLKYYSNSEGTAFKTAFSIAIESKNEEAIKLCMANYQNFKTPTHAEVTLSAAVNAGRPDIIRFLLKKGESFKADDSIVSLGTDAIAELSKYDGIEWGLKQIAAMYKAGDIKSVKRMLNPGIGIEGLEWIISTKDIRLMRHFLKFSNEMQCPRYFPDSWINLDDTWAKCLAELFSDNRRYHESVQSLLHSAIVSGDVRKCKKYLSCYGAVIDSVCLDYSDNKDDEISQIIIEHIAGSKNDNT